MRHFTDSEGTRWEAEDTGMSRGLGSRGLVGPLPEATVTTVLFTTDDGRKVDKEIAVGVFGRMTDDELRELLEEVDEEDED